MVADDFKGNDHSKLRRTSNYSETGLVSFRPGALRTLGSARQSPGARGGHPHQLKGQPDNPGEAHSLSRLRNSIEFIYALE